MPPTLRASNTMHKRVGFFGSGRAVTFKMVLDTFKFFPIHNPRMTSVNIVLRMLSVVPPALLGERIRSKLLLYHGISYVFFV